MPLRGYLSSENFYRTVVGWELKYKMTRVKQVYDNSSQSMERPKVRGWLLLLCIGLTILTPVVSLSTLLGTLGLQRYFEQYPSLYPICLTDTILSTSVVIFSIYAGIRLWAVKPNAVRIAKVYLVYLLAYRGFSIALLFFTGLPTNVIGVLTPEVARTFIQNFVFAIIWLLYISKSKRVQHTYSMRGNI